LFKFFSGNSPLPDFYYDQFICDSLSISKTELDKQPYDWVMKMMDYLKIKSEYQDFKLEVEKKRSNAKKANRFRKR